MTTDRLDPTAWPEGHAPAADLPGLALGAVDAAERRALEAHLAGCPDCRRQLASEDAAVDALLAAVEPIAPSPTLRTRLLAEVAVPGRAEAVPDSAPALASPPAAPPVRVTPSGRARAGVALPRWAVAAGAVAAVLSLLATAALGLALRRVADERDDARAALAAASSYRQDVAAALGAGATIVPLEPAGAASLGPGQGGGIVVAPGGQEGWLVVSGLAPTRPDRSYRVWVARAGDRSRVAELWVGEGGDGWLRLASPEPLPTYDTVGVTVVADGGSRTDLFTAPLPAAVPG